MVAETHTGSHRALRDRLYHNYASQHAGVSHEDLTATRLVLRRDIMPHLPEDRDARILDIGCGQAELVQCLQEAGYWNTEGVDVSPEQVALARSAPCPPTAHSAASTGRVIAWSVASAAMKAALAAETGTLRGHIVTQNLTFVARKSQGEYLTETH